jgi:4-alpha-glucanotransferase
LPLRLRHPDALTAAKQQFAEEIELYQFIQYTFHQQWTALKTYANDNGIRIIGDIPIYVAYDSADVWSEPDQFQLDKENVPTAVAGVPPDGFSADGQLWGNPLYRWNLMKKEGYRWWKRRIGYALTVYDVVRIDHFRAFAGYFSVRYGEETAKNGKWIKGPGISLFKALKAELGANLPIIAEDLGYLTPDVLKLLKDSGFPGMKVLQFAFDTREESDYLPHNYTSHCVVYTGTHDNDTIMGWTASASPADVEMAKRYMHFDGSEGFNWAMMRLALMSVADTCILMMPDLIGLGSEARINTPSTLGGNWGWRIDSNCINDWLADIVYENTALYARLPKE